jgi:hypothetical protein
MDLINSKRILYTASHVTIKLTPTEQKELNRQNGRAIDKLSFIRQLQITPAEAAQLADSQVRPSRRANPDITAPLRLVALLDEQTRSQSLLSALSPKAAEIPADKLIALGDQLAVMRQSPETTSLVRLFEDTLSISPVGRLHLERIEMYPAGVEQGELIFTVPLAPG